MLRAWIYVNVNCYIKEKNAKNYRSCLKQIVAIRTGGPGIASDSGTPLGPLSP